MTNKSFFQPVRSIERGDLAQGFKDSDHILHGITMFLFNPNSPVLVTKEFLTSQNNPKP